MNSLRGNSLVYLMVGGATVVLMSLLATVTTVPQVALGLLIVLILPGYTLTTALFCRQQLSSAERTLLVLSTSLVVTILGSLVIHQSGLSLEKNSWLALCAIVTLAGGFATWSLRRQGNTAQEAASPLNFTLAQMGLLGLAAIIVGIAFMTVRTAAPAAGYQGYTLLWMAPQQAATTNRIQLGVSSKEFAPTQYKLQLRVNEQLAQEWSLIELAPNQEWLATFELPAAQSAAVANPAGHGEGAAPGAVHTVEAFLYRLDQPETAYRRVVLYRDPQVASSLAGVIQ